jgi:hypothetical protein
MKKIGDLILPEETQWIDQYEWSPVHMEKAQTLGGTPIIWSQPLSGGQPITLEIQDGVTWLDQDAVNTIQDMAAQAGASFLFIWDNTVLTVMFRHLDPPALSFKPIWPNYDLFFGTIKLLQV